MQRKHARRIIAVAWVAVGGGLVGRGTASVWTGLGADNKFSTPGNWDVAPGAGSALTFDGAVNPAPLNDLGAGIAFGGITFAPTASSFTITGDPASPGGDIIDNSPNAQALNLNLDLLANRNVTVVAGGTLSIGNPVGGAGAGIVLNGGGTLRLNAANTYTGETILNGGTLAYGADNVGVQTISFGTLPAAGTVSTSTSALDLSAANVTATALNIQTASSTPNPIVIGATKTLTVNGPMIVGINANYTNGQAAADPQAVTNASFTGGGALVVNSGGSNFLVGVNRSNTPTNTDPAATLDLSGLGTFSLTTTGELRVGFGGNIAGTLSLASTSNTITANAVQVGNSNNQNNPGPSRMLLGGGANVINANTINVGGGKTAGSIAFATAGGTLVINGAGGASTTANGVWGASGSATASSTVSIVNLLGHQSVVNMGSLTLGRMSGSTSGGIGACTVSFDTGTFTIGTLQMGLNGGGTAAPGCAGTFNLGGETPNPAATGVLNIGTQLILANNTNTGATATPARGALIINGGTANIGGNVTIINTSTAGTVSGTITLAGGTLNMSGLQIGTGTPPITVNMPAAGQTAALANLGGTGINGTGVQMNGGGTLVLTGALTNYSGGTIVNSGTLQVQNSAVISQGALSVDAGAVADMLSGAPVATKVSSFTIASGGTVDLHDNDMIVGNATSMATVEGYVRTARNGGAWDTVGLTSATARSNASHTTGLGVISGAEKDSAGGTGTFSGQTYGATDTLVKYTWNGDANLDGRVTFDDYVKIDTGFNTGHTGWFNGDFNYSGAVNFDDYVLIDIAFNQQNGTLARAIDWISGDDRTTTGLVQPGLGEVIGHFGQFGAAYGQAFLAAVPEPGSAMGLITAAVVVSRRHRRSR